MRGNIKAVFSTPNNRKWQLRLHQTLQDDFQRSTAHLEMIWKSGSELDDAMVQVGWTHFQRMRHAHAIHLLQQIVGQIVALVKSQVAIEAAVAVRRGQIAAV